MKKSPLRKTTQPHLWQSYLHRIHQEHEVEADTAASQKFWKSYETLIQKSKKPLQTVSPKAVVTPPPQATYDDIFLKYWNGIFTTITYTQQIPSREITEEVDEELSLKEMRVSLGSFELLFLSGCITKILGGGIVGFILIAFILFTTLGSILGNLDDYPLKPKTRIKVIPAHTIQYTFQMKADHLLFIKNNKYESQKTIRLDYYKVKSLMVEGSQLCLKSLYHQSFKDRMNASSIKKNFSIPIDMPQGKEITDFLREILLLNKAQREQ
ncbi:hypothetical protein BKI52_09540 [marine bacterium AO1-C]|nr:hypothetical protein BKI52_09540 [marine bacterium AO1-C]